MFRRKRRRVPTKLSRRSNLVVATSRSTEWRLWIGTVGAIILVGIGAVGVDQVVDEIRLSRNSNRVLENSLKQTYRPLGEVLLVVEAGGKSNLRPYQANNFELFTGSFILKNRGSGPMFYIGSASYSSISPLPKFRSDLLNGKLVDFEIDGLPTVLRLGALHVGESHEINVHWTKVDQIYPMHFYSLFLYIDLEGNLYDTEHLGIAGFAESRKDRNHVDGEEPKTVFMDERQMYNSYNTEETDQIFKLFENYKGEKHELLETLNYYVERNIPER
jgi:hypothetical protein